MKRIALIVAAASLLSACSLQSRCLRGIEGAQQDLQQVRDAKTGLAKASPGLLKASAVLAAAEVARAGKDFEACIGHVETARGAIDEARD